MHSANNERPSKGALHPIQESAQTAQAVSEISKGLQCALTAITIVALWQLPHLGHGMCVYTLFGLHCEVTIHIYTYIHTYIHTVLDLEGVSAGFSTPFTNSRP